MSWLVFVSTSGCTWQRAVSDIPGRGDRILYVPWLCYEESHLKKKKYFEENAVRRTCSGLLHMLFPLPGIFLLRLLTSFYLLLSQHWNCLLGAACLPVQPGGRPFFSGSVQLLVASHISQTSLCTWLHDSVNICLLERLSLRLWASWVSELCFLKSFHTHTLSFQTIRKNGNYRSPMYWMRRQLSHVLAEGSWPVNSWSNSRGANPEACLLWAA